MQKYNFKILYDQNKDIKNWLTAARELEFSGKKWRDGLFGYYLEEFDRISKMDETKAHDELQKFIPKHFSKGIKTAKTKLTDQLSKSFLDACTYLENTTGKELAFTNIEIFLTTFPRAPYSTEDGSMYFCIFWNNITSVFLHEMLHIQVYKYWRSQPNTAISTLNDEEYTTLNESLTFLVDGAGPKIAEQPDRGYEKHSNIRTLLKAQWDKTHDFEKLLEYGTAIIKAYES